MRLLFFPFRLLLDVVSPFSGLVTVAMVVLAVAVVVLAVSILIRARIARMKKRYESIGKRDAPPEDRKEP